MIRHILLISILFLTTNFIYAQPTGVVYNIGPKAGFNIYQSRFQFSEDEQVFDQQMKYGFQVGGTIDMPLKNMIHFAVELYYSHKGKKTFINDTGLTNDAVYHFLEAPILLRFTFNAGKVSSGILKWHLDIGPTISYWFGGKGNLYADGPTSKYDIVFGDIPTTIPAIGTEGTKMYISNANRWQWGLAAGVGVNYPIYKGQVLFIDLRTGLGGTNIGKHDAEANLVPQILGFSDSMDVRFLEFSLSVAYTFEIDWVKKFRGKSTDRSRKKS
jgi:hypothetical protein